MEDAVGKIVSLCLSILNIIQDVWGLLENYRRSASMTWWLRENNL